MLQTAETHPNLLISSKLRPFPAVALRLMSLIQQEEISLLELGQVLETDAALSVMVLRAANSPLFASAEIKSIPLALIVLGVDRVSLLTLTAAVLQTLPGSMRRDYLQAWWRHNLATALLTKHLAPCDLVAEYSYMCGLVHSVGQLLLLEAFPARYETLLAEAPTAPVTLLELEQATFGVDHCELGAGLLRKWNVPHEMQDVAAYYRHPEKALGRTAWVVNAACLVADHIGFPVSSGPCCPMENLPALAEATLQDEKLCLEIAEKVEAIESSLTR